MKMTIAGKIVQVEDKVSQKGNEYTIVKLVQENNAYNYFTSMLDFKVEDKNSYVNKDVVLTLDYNPKFRNFKVTEIN